MAGLDVNAVESREASLEKPETLAVEYEIPTSVATVDGFITMGDDSLAAMVKNLGLGKIKKPEILHLYQVIGTVISITAKF